MIYIIIVFRGRGGLKSYNGKKKDKNHVIIWMIAETVFVFVVATVSIILYDMYINIEVDNSSTTYIAEKTAKEVNTENTNDISEVLENASNSVVRNLENNYK